MSKYIVIPNIQINNANAQPAWWIVGPPAVTAYVGFAHALALNIRAKRHEGVAIVHHDIQFLGEQLESKDFEISFRPHQFRASGFIDKDDYVKKRYVKESMLLSSQPTARCHLNISLVIAMANDSNISATSVELFLRGARIAGGSIINHDQVDCGTTSEEEALSVIKKSAKQTGYSILERQDLMVMQEGDRDTIDTLLRNTRGYRHDSRKQKLKIDKEKIKLSGWIVPTCLGYVGVSSIRERNKARNDLPHLYVEPLVGLIQYRSTRNAGLHFWHYTYPKPNVFVLSINKEL